MVATWPCPLLRWAHALLSVGLPYLWSYISLELHHASHRALVPYLGGPMPILVLGRLIFGVTLVWSYIHQQARFLSPAGGAPGQWCKIKVPEKSPKNSLLKTVLYMKFCV